MKSRNIVMAIFLGLLTSPVFAGEQPAEFGAAILCANHIVGYLNRGFIDYRLNPIWYMHDFMNPGDPEDPHLYSNFPELRNDIAVLPAPRTHMVYIVTANAIYKQSVMTNSDVLFLPQISKPIFLSAQNSGVVATEMEISHDIFQKSYIEVPQPTHTSRDKQAVYGVIYNLMGTIKKRDQRILNSLRNYTDEKSRKLTADSFHDMSQVRSNERRILTNNCAKVKDSSIAQFAQKILGTLPELVP